MTLYDLRIFGWRNVFCIVSQRKRAESYDPVRTLTCWSSVRLATADGHVYGELTGRCGRVRTDGVANLDADVDVRSHWIGDAAYKQAISPIWQNATGSTIEKVAYRQIL